MAFLTAKQISAVAIELLVRDLVLPMTVVRLPGEEFAGSNGDTVTVRVPQPSASRIQSSPGTQIMYDDINEVPVDVTVRHLYNATRVTDESLSLEIVDFASQVTQIQTSAVATGAEDELAEAMNDLVPDDTIASGGTDVEGKILAAREGLSRADVPAADRWLAVSPEVASFMLALDKFSRVDASGDDNALRNAVIGRIYGFTVVESSALDPGTAVGYHRTGFAFANRTPVNPRGAVDSAAATLQGVGLRHVIQYDPDVLSDASVVSTFAGASVVDTDRVFKLDTEGLS